jgi:hypothetical protein
MIGTRPGSNRADRYFQSPASRDAEWDRAKQPPWWLLGLVVAIVGAAFFVGVYAGGTASAVAWVVGIIAIAVFMVLGRARRGRARQQLRQAHQQASS